MDLNNQDYRNILENLHDGLYLTDMQRRITFWNKAAERITGYSAEEVVGKPCADNILCHVDAEGKELCQSCCPLAQTLEDANLLEDEVYLHHKRGHRVPVSVRVTALHGPQNEIIGGIELFSDISNREATELRIKELEAISQLDHLTRMANRAYLEKELRIRIEEMHRMLIPFGVLFIDIDHFKQVNDKYGHAVGDDILRLVADTLTTNARPFDMFGRWGGEEFVGLIRNIELKNLEFLANRMRALVGSAFTMHENRPLHVSVSIGATLMNLDDNLDSLLNRADALLYQSKKNGRNCVTASQDLPEE